jgi:hypothetical protein
MKYILILSSVLILFACTEPDKICNCIAAGDDLNKKSAEILNKIPSKKDETEILKLRKIKKKKCALYEEMSGPEMLKRKTTCEIK